MAYEIMRKGRLPACEINRELLSRLWELFAKEGEFQWHADIGIGGDLLGKEQNRPQKVVTDAAELETTLKSLPRIDRLTISVEISGKGIIALAFRNSFPAGGTTVVTGQDELWVESRLQEVLALFKDYENPAAERIYNKFVFGFIQSGLPLLVAFLIVVFAAGLLIPGEIRRSEYIWWITAGTVVVTLRLAYSLSDWFILHVLTRYPYIYWRD